MSLILCPLHSAARRWSDAIAIDGPQGPINYEQLDAQVGGLVQHLQQLGVKEGEHLGFIGENGLEPILLLLAAMRLGAVFVPISPRFPADLRQQLLSELDVRWLYWQQPDAQLPTGIGALSLSEQTAFARWQVNMAKPLSLILTSGSSGHPKAAMHNLAQHLASAEGSHDQTPLQRGDRWLLSLPLFHIGGLAIIFRALSCGATLVLPSNTTLADDILDFQVSHLSLVATQLQRLLAHPQAMSIFRSLNTLLLGGGAIPSHLLASLKPYGIRALTSYGMTEMASQICTGVANDQGLSGYPLAGRQVRINNDGVIEVRGDCRFLGYYQQGKLTQPFDQDGWFATNDLGLWVGEQIKVIGRRDNMFISGGENVQPESIEAVLKRCDGVEEAIVIAVPDAEFGQLPVAVVKGQWQPELWEKRVLKKLPRFMRPRKYLPWPEQLENTGLKVSRSAIKAYALRLSAL